jgi:hypothetical protein
MNEEQHSELLAAKKIAKVRNLSTLACKNKYKRENQLKRTEPYLEDG